MRDRATPGDRMVTCVRSLIERARAGHRLAAVGVTNVWIEGSRRDVLQGWIATSPFAGGAPRQVADGERPVDIAGSRPADRGRIRARRAQGVAQRRLRARAWGAETRSGGELVLVDEAAEKVAPAQGS
jgi:hypothetical protein